MTIPSMTSIPEDDYCAIEDALQSSEKGRRFLRAYLERNRSFESRRLLRSISRLHRAALGAPGLNAEISRDLISVLRSVSRQRQAAYQCKDVGERSEKLANSLEEVEACLLTLIESVEDRAIERIGGGGISASAFEGADELYSAGPSERLIVELSSYFSSDPRS